MADDGDEVGNQVKGQSQIGERSTEQDLGTSWTAWMREHEAIDPDLESKATTDVLETIGECHGFSPRLVPLRLRNSTDVAERVSVIVPGLAAFVLTNVIDDR